MTAPIIITALIFIFIFVVPFLGNLKTPENLHDWYVSNVFKVALIFGLIIIAAVWILYLF